MLVYLLVLRCKLQAVLMQLERHEAALAKRDLCRLHNAMEHVESVLPAIQGKARFETADLTRKRVDKRRWDIGRIGNKHVKCRLVGPFDTLGNISMNNLDNILEVLKPYMVQ